MTSKFLPSFVALVLQIGFLVGCISKKSKDTSDQTIEGTNSLRYAENFSVSKTPNGVVLTVIEPYKGAPDSRKYLLVNGLDTHAENEDYDAVIQVPIQSIAATATSQAGFIDALDASDNLAGYSTTDFISSAKIRDRIEAGLIIELGRDASINIEALMALSPDMLMAYSASTDVSQWDQIETLGIPVVYDASFLETSPLAQAEWIKFFAAFLGKSDQADSIFNNIEQSYVQLLSLTQNTNIKPTVIGGTMYNGTWFMPGGKSWVATYIQDAGGTYLWENIDQTGSVPLSFESVFEKSLNVDFWIGATAYSTFDQLVNEDERYLKFKAVRDKTIFSPTKKTNGLGGNDYYESGVVRPDLVLSDFIKILHPELQPEKGFNYYKKLE